MPRASETVFKGWLRLRLPPVQATLAYEQQFSDGQSVFSALSG